MMNFTSDQWVIVALIFVLGLLVGGFLFSGGGRKWKTRYREETTRREALEKDYEARRADWDTREKEWREQDSLRSAAAKDRGRDRDADGIRDDRDPVDDRRP